MEEQEGDQDRREQEGQCFGANEQESGEGGQSGMHQEVQHIEPQQAASHVGISQKQVEVFVVGPAHGVPQPGAVVIHAQHYPAHGPTKVGAIWLVGLGFPAPAGFLAEALLLVCTSGWPSAVAPLRALRDVPRVGPRRLREAGERQEHEGVEEDALCLSCSVTLAKKGTHFGAWTILGGSHHKNKLEKELVPLNN